MSTYGSRRTPLFEVKVQHIIAMDDCGNPPNPNVSYVNLFIRVWNREFDINFLKPGRRLYFNRYGSGNIPHLFGWHRTGIDTLPAHQFSGDFREDWQDDPYYGQRPR